MNFNKRKFLIDLSRIMIGPSEKKKSTKSEEFSFFLLFSVIFRLKIVNFHSRQFKEIQLS